LFGGLQRFANFRKLKLDYRFASLKQTDTAGLHHLLELHANSLEELDLHFYPPEVIFAEPLPPNAWFQQKFLHVKIPNLRFLELGTRYFADDIGQTADYLKQFRTSLTSLILRSKRFTLLEVNLIVSPFAGTKLHKLHMAVLHFSPDLLDLLAMKLPNLHQLELEFDRFSSELEPYNLQITSEPGQLSLVSNQ
jgi:hypothetical protein